MSEALKALIGGIEHQLQQLKDVEAIAQTGDFERAIGKVTIIGRRVGGTFAVGCKAVADELAALAVK
jgi:hypothetical protein